MRYRVVLLEDGRYQAQYCTLFFFWSNSCHMASTDKEDAISYAKVTDERFRYRNPSIQAVVWK